jgi:hypothetical protein
VTYDPQAITPEEMILALRSAGTFVGMAGDSHGAPGVVAPERMPVGVSRWISRP